MVVQTRSTIWEEDRPIDQVCQGFRGEVDTVVVGNPTTMARNQELAVREGGCYRAGLGTSA